MLSLKVLQLEKEHEMSLLSQPGLVAFQLQSGGKDVEESSSDGDVRAVQVINRHIYHASYVSCSLAPPQRTPLHMGDRSLIHHLLNEGRGEEVSEVSAASPTFFGVGDGLLNVTAAATPSILKHSPSPLPPSRSGSGDREEMGGVAVAVTFKEGGAPRRENMASVVPAGGGSARGLVTRDFIRRTQV
jgi:hypothetical protein